MCASDKELEPHQTNNTRNLSPAGKDPDDALAPNARDDGRYDFDKHNAQKYGMSKTNPVALAGLATFARIASNAYGVGKMKTDTTTANPFYATMAESAATQARTAQAAPQVSLTKTGNSTAPMTIKASPNARLKIGG